MDHWAALAHVAQRDPGAPAQPHRSVDDKRLRSIIAPIYLLATVLLSYGTTLSLVSWIFQDLLKQDGFGVKIATGGEEALQVLRESVPSMILLDLVMPGLDGFKVVREMQKNESWKKIPVVVLTGKTLTDADHEELDPYVAAYLMKETFTTAAIKNAIRKTIGTVPSSS